MWFIATLAGCFASASGEAPPSIVLVSLDTTRADRLGAYGGPAGLTPSLDRFASEAVVFTHAYSQTTTTGPSHASLFTSRYPSEQAGRDRKPVLGSSPLLAEILRTYGYQTGAFVAGGDLVQSMGLDKGFDTYTVAKDFASFFHTIPSAMAWIDAHDEDRPFFAFVHGYDAHARYLKPTPWGYVAADRQAQDLFEDTLMRASESVIDGQLYPSQRRMEESTLDLFRPRSAEGRATLPDGTTQPVTAEQQTLIRAIYDGAVAYEDTLFGLLMAQLSARGLLEKTIVVVLADHGEQLGEDGIYNHCCDVQDWETHVPLMVRIPGNPPGRVDGLVELVDVMPTLLELASAVPPAGARGHSLLPAVRGEPFEGRALAFSQGFYNLRMTSARSADGRLTYDGLPSGTPPILDVLAAAPLDGPSFRLTEGLDVAEAVEVRAGMVEWMGHLDQPTSAGEGLPEAMKESLKQRGYW